MRNKKRITCTVVLFLCVLDNEKKIVHYANKKLTKIGKKSQKYQKKD